MNNNNTVNSSWDGVYNYADFSNTLGIDEIIKKRVFEVLDGEDNLVPLVKEYLYNYLEKVLDNPDEVIDEIINERVKKKAEELKELQEMTERLKTVLKDLQEQVTTLQILTLPQTQTTSPCDPMIDLNDPYNNPYKPYITNFPNSSVGNSTWKWSDGTWRMV